MTRTTRNIALGLLGSAMLTACFLSCSGCGTEPERQIVGHDKDGNPIYASTSTTRRRYGSSSSWWWSRPTYYRGGSSYSPGPSVGRSSGSGGGSTSKPSIGGSTSRGGFGGTGSGSSGS
ncbi:MAG: hypothetical protein U0746_16870 [Gemmataceae bacterium]